MNRVNFKTNRTFESGVVTEKWHKTALKPDSESLFNICFVLLSQLH